MTSDLERIAPGLLIAAPALSDPNFHRTVILLCAHNEQGAMGLVINREAPITTHEVMWQLDMDVRTETSQAVMAGGPVSPQSALLLYQPNQEQGDAHEEELQVGDDLRLSPGRALLEAIAAGKGPARYHLFLGHSGWGPGQLEQEISHGAWLPAALRMNLLFDTPLDRLWDETLVAEGMSPAAFGLLSPKN
ncbi:MAG: YqgE/AlgH family protein [Deltaproteobacteria bacterium]|nr:YqgE/AlgH family protein [Deltaproteobacteria bacterium]